MWIKSFLTISPQEQILIIHYQAGSRDSSSLLYQVLCGIFVQNFDDGVEIGYYFSYYLVIISYFANYTRMQKEKTKKITEGNPFSLLS